MRQRGRHDAIGQVGIEAFVRHNARFVDAFFFIDESVDATRTLLGRLQAEGFDITVLDSTSTVYEQRMLITSALRIVDGLNAFDWVVLLIPVWVAFVSVVILVRQARRRSVPQPR